METKIKKITAILLAVCFLVSLTAASASAGENSWGSHMDNGEGNYNTPGFDNQMDKLDAGANGEFMGSAYRGIWISTHIDNGEGNYDTPGFDNQMDKLDAGANGKFMGSAYVVGW